MDQSVRGRMKEEMKKSGSLATADTVGAVAKKIREFLGNSPGKVGTIGDHEGTIQDNWRP